jgi:hypothetical protein
LGKVYGTAKQRIAEVLGRFGLPITLETQAAPTIDLIQDGPATFIDDGKSFWVLPWRL